MQPPNDDKRGATAGSTDPRPGVIVVGHYALDIGHPTGTIVSQSSSLDQAAADSLAQALREQKPAPEPEKGAAEAAGDLVDEASTATAKVERAVAIGKGAAAGNVLDPAQLGLEADALLDLLERLDREGRAKEALRLARALSKLYSLLRRWAELLRALQAALRAGEKLGDLKTIGWAKHELGTFHLAGGDVDGAGRILGEAREIRRRLGDRADLAATEHNLRACSHLPHGVERATSHGRPRTVRLRLTLAIGMLLFVVGLAGGAALGDSGGKSVGKGAAITEAATNTPAGTEAETVTETETDTVTETETVTEVVKSPGESEAGETGETKSGESESFEEEELIR